MTSYNQRIVITGMGVAAPNGISCEEYKKALIGGKSGIGKVTNFDASHLPVYIAAETSLPPDFMADQSDPKGRFMNWAAREAFKMAFSENPYRPEEGVISLGVGLDLFSLPKLVEYFHTKGDPSLPEPTERVVFELAKKYRCHRPPHILVSACAASADAIGVAMEQIRQGKAKWALAGGVDSMINPLGFSAFTLLGAMSKGNDLMERASRPFDKNRDGFVMGEGAGALILENYIDAEKRGAPIYGELVGWGNSFDAHGISEPHPEGEGAVLAMTRAIADAGLKPEDIDYINAHGTSTPKNDITETLAIHRVFATPPPVSSTKSMIGHCISAAGVLELIGVFLCQQEGYLPPTMNLQEPGEGCDLDYIPGKAREKRCRYFLSNSFAFGGQNTSIVGRVVGH